MSRDPRGTFHWLAVRRAARHPEIDTSPKSQPYRGPGRPAYGKKALGAMFNQLRGRLFAKPPQFRSVRAEEARTPVNDVVIGETVYHKMATGQLIKSEEQS